MAKVKMPLLGVKASGQLGKSAVFGSWKGVQYARTLVIPKNPRTEEQMLTRNTFSFLNELWKLLPAEAIRVWELFSSGKPLTSRNAFLQRNILTLREASSLLDFVASPGVGGGYAPEDAMATVDAANNRITVTIVPPSLPAGWSVVAAYAMALRDQDPHEKPMEAPKLGTATTSPYSVTLDNLTDGASYVIAIWIEYEKPDGSTVFGPSVNVGPFTV